MVARSMNPARHPRRVDVARLVELDPRNADVARRAAQVPPHECRSPAPGDYRVPQGSSVSRVSRTSLQQQVFVVDSGLAAMPLSLS